VDLEHGALYPVEETPFHHKYAGEELAYRRFECERLRIMEGRGAYAGASPHNFPEKVTEPHIFTDSALGYLKRRKDAAQPFCLCVSWVQPHAPHIAPDFLHKFYGPRPFRLPEAGPCAEALRQKADRYRVKYQAQRSHLATEAEKRNFIATYYAMVTAIDRQFGRLMEALAALGLEKNTIVVFTSDHGDFLFQNGLCKKDLVMAEALLRVPLLIRWPGRLAPRVADEGLMEAVDVLPTLLEFLGLELPLGVQGASACGYLRGDTAAHKSAVFGEVCAPWQYNPYPTFAAMEADWQEKYHHQAPLNVPGDFTKSVRTPTHRYCWYATGQEELYDLTADPTEEHNLAALPAHRETLAALKLRLFEWCVRSEDPLDPKLCAKNQQRYNRWRFRKPEDGAEGGPVWLEQARAAFCKNQNL
jgi:arylsulfatase A-like enzyme